MWSDTASLTSLVLIPSMEVDQFMDTLVPPRDAPPSVPLKVSTCESMEEQGFRGRVERQPLVDQWTSQNWITNITTMDHQR